MQKVSLAVPRSFQKGFHYTEKNRLCILGETHIAIRKLLETGGWLTLANFWVCSWQVLLAGQKICCWSSVRSLPPLWAPNQKGTFFFFFPLETLSRHITPICTQCWPWPTAPLLQAVALGSTVCHRQAQQNQLTPKRSSHTTSVVDTRCSSLQQGGKVGRPCQRYMPSIGEVLKCNGAVGSWLEIRRRGWVAAPICWVQTT